MTTAQYLRTLLVGVALPALVGVISGALIVTQLPHLPDRVAVHWGVDGQPDGFGTPWILVVLPALAILYSGFALVVTRSARAQGITWAQRSILAIGVFLAVVLGAAGAGSAYLQVGLTDAAAAPTVLPLLAVALLAGAVAAIAAWFALPRHVRPAAITPESAPPLALASTERVLWLQRIEPSRGVVALIVGGLALGLTAGGIVVWASGPLPNLFVWLGILVLVGVSVASTMFWTVRVDANGLSVRSALGAPHFRYPLDELVSAGVTDVVPGRDFAGWGIRTVPGKRTGIVVRAGEAIEVQRTGGRVLVITVDDARQGASLLSALIARSNERIQ
ncbi:MFS family permease [Microbacteriaceae bacterium SG_E_30_P1]|uniref:MFS family permease n=1 Tax=Antiquaquibacter oligotrophicus TaxID=2880260 RepID=A0ABT6KMJ7_9MICO|nr:DUF1648 domain-containing protein [Antiquaquibacter oligotrophicus]MDH6181229.1 MFS family permease [Antiquaquibacter oligotrophicus]UDF13076.1 DUF1648 domain-containing protein [Antiquaquibacter oligotrophicus]